MGIRANINQRINLFSFYTLGYARNDTDGSGTTPANPYDLSTEYGRASSDSRHQFTFVGNFTLPGQIRITPNINLRSGGPFNILTGRDNNGDNQFSDRPAFANPGDPGAIVTPFGTFNPTPLPGDQIIPRNFGAGPGAIIVNLGVSRTFGFGPPPNNFPGMSAASRPQQNQTQQNAAQNEGGRTGRGGPNAGGQGRGSAQAGNSQGGRGAANAGGQGRGGAQGGGSGPVMMMAGGGGMMMMGGPGGFGSRHKYNLTIGINASNVLNHFNEGRINGTLTSPFFGQSNSASGGGGGFGGFGGFGGGRRIDLSMRFNF
jgi:hypothetical protein